MVRQQGLNKLECSRTLFLARKFKPGAFRLQNYWISYPERTFLGSAS